jgi:hypothetical protein
MGLAPEINWVNNVGLTQKVHLITNDRKNNKTETITITITRTAWAVFKYCGTKNVPLRMKKKI